MLERVAANSNSGLAVVVSPLKPNYGLGYGCGCGCGFVYAVALMVLSVPCLSSRLSFLIHVSSMLQLR
jgi:hypothetical protein